jgi:hypothetical protein
VATFIPEWTGEISAPQRKMKDVFAALDNAFVVRKPLAGSRGTPALFLQHPSYGWLALAFFAAPASTIVPRQLFPHENLAQFTLLLQDFECFGDSTAKVAKVVLLWGCSREEAHDLSHVHGPVCNARFVSREDFLGWNEQILGQLLAPVTPEQQAALLGVYFPETEIPPAYATRRHLRRDNSATLTRLFLDAQQEWAAKQDLEAPGDQARLPGDLSVRLINGVAGSGKTLIILKRAMLLARQASSSQILITSHNTPIAADLEARLRRAHDDVPANLEIRTFYSLATQEWKRLHRTRADLPPRSEILKLIADLTRDWSDQRLGKEDLFDEIEFIDEALIADEPAYLAASRVGRGFALRPKERSEIWRLRQAVVDTLAAQGQQLWSSIPRQICESADRGRRRKYSHILVDEAQFFAPSWFEVIKLALAPGGQLFLCADPNQGFLRSRLSWKRAGLDVAGRTKKLRNAYRTTRAMLEAAHQVLSSSTTEDPEEFLRPDYSHMEVGAPPLLLQVASPQDAVDRVTNEITAATTNDGLRLHDVLVIYGPNLPKDLLYQRLCQSLGEARVWWLNKEDQKRHPPGTSAGDHLRMAYVDSATGLEATLVFVLGAERLLADASDEGARKLYMAMTRAAQRLVLVCSEPPPARIAHVFRRMS